MTKQLQKKGKASQSVYTESLSDTTNLDTTMPPSIKNQQNSNLNQSSSLDVADGEKKTLFSAT
jgi:hypothetical protein